MSDETAKLERIRGPEDAPSTDQSEITAREFAHLKPGEQDRHERRHLTRVLETEHKLLQERYGTQNEELKRLRPIEVDHARLVEQGRRWRRRLAVDTGIASGGAGLIGLFPYGSGYPELFAIGVAALVIVVAHAMFKAIFGS